MLTAQSIFALFGIDCDLRQCANIHSGSKKSVNRATANRVIKKTAAARANKISNIDKAASGPRCPGDNDLLDPAPDQHNADRAEKQAEDLGERMRARFA